MNVLVNDNLTVSFDVLTFVSMVVYLFQRAAGSAAWEAATNIPGAELDSEGRVIPPRIDFNPGRFKISLIKMVRHLPGHTFSLKDAKDIVEFVFENRSAIERLAEAAR
jgi:ribosomal protein L7/L12